MLIIKDYVRFVTLPISIIEKLDDVEKVHDCWKKYKMKYPVFVPYAKKLKDDGYIVCYDKKESDDVTVDYIYFDDSIFEFVEDNNMVSSLKGCIEDKDKEICKLKKVLEEKNKSISYWVNKCATMNNNNNGMEENSNTFNNTDMYWNKRYIKLRKYFYSLKDENEDLKNKLHDAKFNLRELKLINIAVDEKCCKLINELKEIQTSVIFSGCQNTWYDKYRKYVDPEKDIPVDVDTLINLSENVIEKLHIVSHHDEESEKCKNCMTIKISDCAPQEIINGILIAIGRNSNIFNRPELEEMEIKYIEIE